MTVATFDSGKSEAFAGRMMSMLNDGALAIMTSIGHRAGLFDAMAEIPPSTSDQVAAAAGLHARYVREWLDAMTTGGIVEHDPEHRTYRLAPEHAAWLTRAAGPNNLAAPAQFIPLQAQVESAVLECFRGGGGLPYSAYPRFHELMAEDSAAIQDATLLDAVLPLVSGLTERLTSGVDVADVGCGTGHALNLMARAYPESRFLGWDISSEGIAAGRSEAADMGLTNVSYEVRDAATLDVHGRFAFVTAFDAIHDQADPAEVLARVARALEPGGVFLMVDFGASSRVEENVDFPLAPFLYSISCMHCTPVSIDQGGPGLGAMWGEQTATRMLAEAGFSDVQVSRIEQDPLNAYFIARSI